MPFDLSSAKPVDAGDSGFDLSSAKPVGSSPGASTPAGEGKTPDVFDRATGAFRQAQGAIGEPLMALGSSMVAKPVSDIAGLGAIPLHAMGAIDTEPTEVKRKVQSALTYEPRTEAGKLVSQYNPLALLGKAIGAGAEKVGGVVSGGPEGGPVRAALGAGVTEAIEQAPTFLGVKAPAAAARAAGAVRGGAEELMQSALKPSAAALRTGKAGKAVDTLLDEGINVTPGGVQTLKERIGDLNDRIAARIDGSPATIDKAAVTERLRPVIKKFAKQVNMLDDIRAIQKVYDEFMAHPLLNDKIPVKRAQEVKQGTYSTLGDKSYGEVGTASTEAQKALARGLKEEIAAAVPEVRTLNAEESKLLNALSLTERRVLMSANKNPMGLGLLSLKPSHMLAFMADRSELFKSIVARMLNTTSKGIKGAGDIGVPLGAAVSNQAGPPPLPPQ